MQEVLDYFYEEVRRKRKRKHYTQRSLADRLHVSMRTIMDIENGHTVPRLDTVIAICLELDISLDAALFPNASSSIQSKSASDFLSGKNEKDIQKYIALCQFADDLYSGKSETIV